MTTLQLNHYKFAAENSSQNDEELDKVYNATKGIMIGVPAIGGGLLGGLGGGLTTLFNTPENRTWGNALKRALIGMAIGSGIGGGYGYLGTRIVEPFKDMMK